MAAAAVAVAVCGEGDGCKAERRPSGDRGAHFRVISCDQPCTFSTFEDGEARYS